MSQVIKNLASGPVPPSVPQTFTADDGSIAVPVANNLNLFSRDTTANNVNGIQTTADPNLSDNFYVELTNRLQGTGSTVGAVTTDLVTFSLGATPATYVIEANFVAFESTTPAGAGYSLFGTVRTTGAAASLVGTPDKINNENAALVPSTADIVVSGNNVILRVLGTVGLTVNWAVVGYYVRVT